MTALCVLAVLIALGFIEVIGQYLDWRDMRRYQQQRYTRYSFQKVRK